MSVYLDGSGKTAVLSTNFDAGPKLVWSACCLGDGDHQLFVSLGLSPPDGSVAVDYFEYVVPYSTLSRKICSNRLCAFRVENLSGNGFDLLWAGPNATNVPKEAIIVDNSNPDIVFHTPSLWVRHVSARYFGGTMVSTSQPETSLSFSFEGVAIWYDFVSYT